MAMQKTYTPTEQMQKLLKFFYLVQRNDMRYLKDNLTELDLTVPDLLANAHRRLIDEGEDWEILDAL